MYTFVIIRSIQSKLIVIKNALEMLLIELIIYLKKKFMGCQACIKVLINYVEFLFEFYFMFFVFLKKSEKREMTLSLHLLF